MADKISEITHPEYEANYDNWVMYRLVGEGGEEFLNKYLLKRPQEQSFDIRKKLSYIPAFAKSAIRRVENSIRQRLTAVVRSGGSPNYQKAAKGLMAGVDRAKKSMNTFIGDEVLPELVKMGAVGVYVDSPRKGEEATLQDDLKETPYLYVFKVENIRGWHRDPRNPNYFDRLLLMEYVEVSDNEWGLATEVVPRYRFYSKDENGNVTVSFYNEDDEQINPFTNEPSGEIFALTIDHIPFIFFQLSDSLLSDIARHQIALLNLASADMKYAWEGNVVFLAEEYDPNAPDQYFRTSSAEPGTDTVDTSDRSPERRFIGVNKGVKVVQGLKYPEYISPQTGPLEVSMKKQIQIKQDIDDILNQNLKSLSARSTTSTEAKEIDERKEEDGLKAIGDELEHGEQQIAYFWAMYEGNINVVAEVSYPDNYQFKNDRTRREEATELHEISKTTPSLLAKKAISKLILHSLLTGHVADDELEKMKGEIDNAVGFIADPKTLRDLIEVGAVSPETAVLLLGFPADEAVKAEDARVRRAAAIAEVQANAGPAGVAELATNPGQEDRARKQAARLDGKQVYKR